MNFLLFLIWNQSSNFFFYTFFLIKWFFPRVYVSFLIKYYHNYTNITFLFFYFIIFYLRLIVINNVAFDYSVWWYWCSICDNMIIIKIEIDDPTIWYWFFLTIPLFIYCFIFVFFVFIFDFLAIWLFMYIQLIQNILFIKV